MPAIDLQITFGNDHGLSISHALIRRSTTYICQMQSTIFSNAEQTGRICCTSELHIPIICRNACQLCTEDPQLALPDVENTLFCRIHQCLRTLFAGLDVLQNAPCGECQTADVVLLRHNAAVAVHILQRRHGIDQRRQILSALRCRFEDATFYGSIQNGDDIRLFTGGEHLQDDLEQCPVLLVEKALRFDKLQHGRKHRGIRQHGAQNGLFRLQTIRHLCGLIGNIGCFSHKNPSYLYRTKHAGRKNTYPHVLLCTQKRLSPLPPQRSP
jgi:hypothetical protein